MKKKIVGYSVFFIVLIGLFLVFTFWGTDKWKSKSPTISYVKPFVFTTQNGEGFTEKNMQGKVCLVNYFFTTSPTAFATDNPITRLTINSTTKIKNNIFAIDAAPAAIPPNPNTAAIIAIIKNIRLQRNI